MENIENNENLDMKNTVLKKERKNSYDTRFQAGMFDICATVINDVPDHLIFVSNKIEDRKFFLQHATNPREYIVENEWMKNMKFYSKILQV